MTLSLPGFLASWVQPLPVVITPEPEELLFGGMLRTDKANGYPAGTTGSMVALHRAGPVTFGRPGMSVLGVVFDLAMFAAMLGCDLDVVVEMTLRVPLTRLFGLDVKSKRLGRLGLFRICPACIADGWLIRKETILPFVERCSKHGTRLVSHCSCGDPLQPTSGGQEPFQCSGCWRGWETLPAEPLSQWDDLRQRRIGHTYRVLMDRGDARLRRRISLAKELDGPPRWDGGWSTRPNDLEQLALARKGDLVSLASFVGALVAREIPPERMFEVLPAPTRVSLTCHNRTCPYNGRSGSVRLNGYRRGEPESYCAECGSRFIGGRTILSFDLDNGSQLHPIVVERARARLAHFHELLASACDQHAELGLGVHIGSLFRSAGIPNARYLRARRLGLVDLVRSRLGRTVTLDPDCHLPDPSLRWNSPRGRARADARQHPGPLKGQGEGREGDS